MPKHCCWGLCKSDSRYPQKYPKSGITWIPFPKPKTFPEKAKRWAWLPDGYSLIFRIVCVWPFGLEGLWLRYATLQNLIPSFPWIAPHALHPGAIQGKEGIKFCHLATLDTDRRHGEQEQVPQMRVDRRTRGERSHCRRVHDPQQLRLSGLI